MLNLMKLEMQRMNFRKIFLSFLFINLGIFGLLLLSTLDVEEEMMFENAETIMEFIQIITVYAFVIHAAVLISTIIIDEFKSKTITILFLSPISRKKILLSKLLIICIITFILITISIILLFSSFTILNNIVPLISTEISLSMLLDQIGFILIIALAGTGVSLIPIFFGMMKYSTPATIVSSVLIMSMLTSSFSNEGSSLISIPLIPLTLGVIGFIVAYAVINRAVVKDF